MEVYFNHEAVYSALLLGAGLVVLVIILGMFACLVVGMFEDANRNDVWYDEHGRRCERKNR